MRKIILWLVFGLVALFVLIQTRAVWTEPYQPTRRSRAGMGFATDARIGKRACFDCHSNETVWPWYSNIAPVSGWSK